MESRAMLRFLAEPRGTWWHHFLRREALNKARVQAVGWSPRCLLKWAGIRGVYLIMWHLCGLHMYTHSTWVGVHSSLCTSLLWTK